MILYFSATGNCKYVAERIAAEFDDTAVSIEVSNGQVNLSENEMLGIVTPVYNWELPITTREFFAESPGHKCLCAVLVHCNNVRNNGWLHVC